MVAETEPKTLSYIITDLRHKRLAGIMKDTFEDLLKSLGIPCRDICRRSFATLDVPLAKKLAGSNVPTKNFRFQPEYKGTWWIQVTVCCVLVQLNGDVIAVYMNTNGNVKEVTMVRLADVTVHGDFVLDICNQDPHMMVVGEGRKPLCCSCKQLVHLARTCPQKSLNNNQTSSNINNNNFNIKEKTINPTTNPASELGNQPKPEEGWTQVTGKRKRTIEQTTGATTKAKTIPIKAAGTPTEVTTKATTTTTTKKKQQ